MSTIQDRLRIFMHFKKLNATQLAEIIDVQRSSVSHVLNGRNKPSLEFVQRLVNEFPEVSFEWLVNGSGSLNKKDTDVTPVSAVSKDSIDTKVTPNVIDVSKSSSESTDEPSSREVQHTDDHSKSIDKEKVNDIKKIVVFYANGTFEEYFPK